MKLTTALLFANALCFPGGKFFKSAGDHTVVFFRNAGDSLGIMFNKVKKTTSSSLSLEEATHVEPEKALKALNALMDEGKDVNVDLAPSVLKLLADIPNYVQLKRVDVGGKLTVGVHYPEPSQEIMNLATNDMKLALTLQHAVVLAKHFKKEITDFLPKTNVVAIAQEFLKLKKIDRKLSDVVSDIESGKMLFVATAEGELDLREAEKHGNKIVWVSVGVLVVAVGSLALFHRFNSEQTTFAEPKFAQ